MDVAMDIHVFRYRERFHLSYADLMDEPVDEINQALLIWSLDDERAKLEGERQNQRTH